MRGETLVSRRSSRGGTLLAATLAMALLAGCQSSPVIAERDTTGSESEGVLRTWVADEVDAVTELLALETSWRFLLEPSLEWPADSTEIFDASHRPRCSFNDQNTSASVSVSLITDPLTEDLEGLLTPARERWEAEGRTISEIGSSGYIRGDRADGAFLTLEAAAGEAGSFVSLMVTSWCSTGTIR